MELRLHFFDPLSGEGNFRGLVACVSCNVLVETTIRKMNGEGWKPDRILCGHRLVLVVTHVSFDIHVFIVVNLLVLVVTSISYAGR